jgi:hypothetical protein
MDLFQPRFTISIVWLSVLSSGEQVQAEDERAYSPGMLWQTRSRRRRVV